MIFGGLASMIVLNMMYQEYLNQQGNQDRADQQAHDWKMAYYNQSTYEYNQKHALQWRIEDAEKAGIHPLAAIGINPAAGPVGRSSNSMPQRSDFAGQNLARLASTFMSQEARDLEMAKEREQLRRLKLENEALIIQNEQRNDIPRSAGLLAGQAGQGMGIKVTPEELPYQYDGTAAGGPPKYQFHRTGNGYFEKMPHDMYKNKMEDSPKEWVYWTDYYWKNITGPFIHAAPGSTMAFKARENLRIERAKVPVQEGFIAVWDQHKSKWKEVPIGQNKYGFYYRWTPKYYSW